MRWRVRQIYLWLNALCHSIFNRWLTWLITFVYQHLYSSSQGSILQKSSLLFQIFVYIFMYIYICFSKTLYPEKYPAKLFGPDPGIRNVSRLVKLHSSRLLKRILTPQGNTQRYVFSRGLFSWKIIESSDTFGV